MFGKKIEILYMFSLISGMLILMFILGPLINTFNWIQKDLMIEALHDDKIIKSILLSMKCATYSMLLAFVLGVSFAYYIERHEFYGKRFLESIIDIPMVMPHTVVGIALLTVLSRRSALGKFMMAHNIDILGTEIAIVIAMLFVSLPLMFNSAKEAFKWIPVRMENVSRSLGASHFKTFFTITFRLAWRDLLSGMIITWARSISEFGAVIILAYHPMIAPTLIYERFSTYGIIYAIPVTAILMMIAMVLFIALRLVASNNRKRVKL